MANRRSLALRRDDANAPLRPTTGFDSALRSDFFYIPEDLDPPEIFLVARDVSHTTVQVAFDPTKIPVDVDLGTATETALVRSPSGYPATLLDGAMIRRHPTTAPQQGGWVMIPDSGLTPGNWYYYALFGKYVYQGNTHWLRVGQASVLMPAELLSADHLWERIPEWYRRTDQPPDETEGVLRRLINTVGYQTDAHRTWAMTVGDVFDAEKISADLLPWLGDTLGQPVEYAAGDQRYRALISRILPLRKLKGTAIGTEAYLSSITGYRTEVYNGLNLLPTPDEAEARYSSGMWTNTGTSSTLTRVLSSGPAPGPAAGRYYYRLTFNGTTSQQPALRLGSGVPDLTRLVPVTAGHQITTSALYRSSFSGAYQVRYRWFSAAGTLLGMNTVALGAIGVAWVRRLAAPVTVPANVAFAEVNLELSVATTTAGLVVETTDILVADQAWRPEGVPGVANTPPLSSANPADGYAYTGYYESPRTVHANVYPQRVNYALNSDFTLNNLPAGAWTVAESATWGLLRTAYTSWGDIIDAQPGDSESSWGDLAGGFAPLAGSWTMTFDTVNHRLQLNPGGPPSYAAQVQSDFIPVNAGESISAAFTSWATVAGVNIMFTVAFYTDDNAGAVLRDSAGSAVLTHGKAWVMTTNPYRYELRSVTIPAGATFARVIIETAGAPVTPVTDVDGNPVLDANGNPVTTGTGAYVAYLQKALIENAQIPGPYFDGNEVDASYGDYFFVGQPYQSYSVYYQNFRSFINAAGGQDRVTTLMTELLPPATDFIIRTAAGGIF